MMKRIMLVAALAVAIAGSAQAQAITNKDIANAVKSPTRAEAVVPNDAVDLPHVTTAIWCATTGTIKVDMVNGGTVTLTGVPAGTMLRIAAKRVWSAGTTVTLMIAFF